MNPTQTWFSSRFPHFYHFKVWSAVASHRSYKGSRSSTHCRRPKRRSMFRYRGGPVPAPELPQHALETGHQRPPQEFHRGCPGASCGLGTCSRTNRSRSGAERRWLPGTGDGRVGTRVSLLCRVHLCRIHGQETSVLVGVSKRQFVHLEDGVHQVVPARLQIGQQFESPHEIFARTLRWSASLFPVLPKLCSGARLHKPHTTSYTAPSCSCCRHHAKSMQPDVIFKRVSVTMRSHARVTPLYPSTGTMIHLRKPVLFCKIFSCADLNPASPGSSSPSASP